MIRKTMLILTSAILLAGIAGCTDSDNSSDDKKRSMSTQQPTPLQPPPSGRTGK